MPVDPRAAAPAVITIAEAAERLRGGEPVAFPTETVYGLGAPAFDAEAVSRVFAIKGRPPNNPLIVHVADRAMARGVVSGWPAEAERLADAFWPGPLTLVLPRAAVVPGVVVAGGPTVAVRTPDHPVATGLIGRVGQPLVAPSANPSGGVSPTRADHVVASFAGRVAVVDGGVCRTGIESTVVRLPRSPGEPAVVLRPGAVDAGAIADVLGTTVDFATSTPGTTAAGGGSDSDAAPSPGMIGRHYAPRTPVRLLDRPRVEAALAGPGRLVVVAIGAPADHAGRHAIVTMPADAPTYAARLYAALREADAIVPPADAIVVELPPRDGGLWRAIRDRLERAALDR